MVNIPGHEMNKPSDKYLSNLRTVSLWLGFLQKNTVRFANEDAKIGVVQMVYLPPHLPDEKTSSIHE